LKFAVRTGRAPGAKHTASKLFSLMDLCAKHGVEIHKSYLHTFANGVSIYSLHTNAAAPDDVCRDLKTEANMILTLPDNHFLEQDVRQGVLTSWEAFYLHTASVFAYYFLYQHNDDYETLFKHFKGDDAS